ncbi:MAG: hypothetical protein FD167_2689, partial [bacterium]
MKHRGKIILAIFLGSGLVVCFLVFLLLVSIFSRSAPTVATNSILELKLEGDMPESGSDDPFLKL